MGNVTPITEQFQHFVKDLQESFWGDLNGKAQAAMKALLEEKSRQARGRFVCRGGDERRGGGGGGRDGGSRGRRFLPAGMRAFQRRAEDVLLLIREAFLRGISTRQVGRVVGIVTGEAVSAQTVSTITKSLDRLGGGFHERRLKEEGGDLFL